MDVRSAPTPRLEALSLYSRVVGPHGRRRSIIAVTVLGICMLVVAVTLNVGWVVLNWRTGLMLFLGILFFAMLIAGLALNTIFLIREIRRNEQHDSFINSVTHELKTPIASIRLYLETLQQREPDASKRQEFYDVMLADSDRLLATIEKVLEAGRAGSAKRVGHKAPVDMAELVSECAAVARTRHRLGEDAIQVSAPVAAWVEGDNQELRAAISNLIENAVKYSGAEVRVRAEIARRDGFVTVRVSDEGAGIPPRELKHVFKRFYRIPGALSQRVKGTGLGLFIVSSIAKRHGGKVFAESEGSGRGSTFTLELPSS
jgi:signal transduction histidine kinase